LIMHVCQDGETALVERVEKRAPPGFLLAPFRWAAEPVSKLTDLDPTVCVDLCKIGRTRMHVIALALAHSKGPSTTDLARLLVCGSFRQIITETLGRDFPAGLSRAVAHMPANVLAKENYRRLIDLLHHGPTATLLFHVDAIDDTLIDVIYHTPATLRRPVMLFAINRGREWSRFAGISDGLRILVARGAARNFNDLVSNLAAAERPREFVAKLRAICDSLPLPKTLPPARIGRARRLDCIKEIRALASQWQNCLRDYIGFINNGCCAIYLWQDELATAVCLVGRHGRFGWFLDEVKGPKNTPIGSYYLATIDQSFADANVPRNSLIAAVEHLYDDTRGVPF
jgi:hypothetical protein